MAVNLNLNLIGEVYLEAVGLAAPGLLGWQASRPILRGEQDYVSAALEKYKPQQLPANEARRATELVRMAFRVCEDLMANTAMSLGECASVFSSSGGDYPVIDQICQSLCEPERLVSPTQFHNSVHNSAAGYWSIATGSRLPSSSISGYDDSFCAGLLEAVSLCCIEQLPTMLVVYDIKPPYPLSEKRVIPAEFGVALLLSPTRTPNTSARLQLSALTAAQASSAVATIASPALASLASANPAARSLPLLELLAKQQPGKILFRTRNLNGYQLEVGECS